MKRGFVFIPVVPTLRYFHNKKERIYLYYHINVLILSTTVVGDNNNIMKRTFSLFLL